MLDRPSRGGTCFPAVVAHDTSSYEVFNYSSPVDGEDVNWVEGQWGPTNLYRSLLVFP